jgi:hypothetical protein
MTPAPGTKHREEGAQVKWLFINAEERTESGRSPGPLAQKVGGDESRESGNRGSGVSEHPGMIGWI